MCRDEWKKAFETVGDHEQRKRQEITGKSSTENSCFVGAIGIWEMENEFGSTTWGQMVKSPERQAEDADSSLQLSAISANKEISR